MKHSFSPYRSQLIIEIDEDEKQTIREYGEEMHCDSKMHEFFENFMCNSEFEWIPEGATGDLTNAPMLGIYEYDPELESGDGSYYIVERWAFMEYETKSVLETLLNNGRVVFVS